MKKFTKLFISTLFIVCFNEHAFSQADQANPVTGHIGGIFTGYYLGWDNTTTFPLNIRHDSANNINFWTDDTLRATIIGINSFNKGWFGIGKNFTNVKSLLDVDARLDSTPEVFRTNVANPIDCYWRLLRDDNPIGSISSRRGSMPDSNNFIITANDNDITFRSGNPERERMRIVGPQRTSSLHPYIVRPGNVGIGNTDPLSMLHIGGKANSTSGYRSWMDIGTFMLTYENDNHMYVGLKRLGAPGVVDRNKEVICWGDNPTDEDTVRDMLSFIFTAATSLDTVLYPAARDSGLETARMVSDGRYGYMGVGKFDQPGIDAGLGYDPKRRLEVLDNGQNAPQFRLTYTQDSDVNKGINTDFKSTSDGDLWIHPSKDSIDQRVGINTQDGTHRPGNTLEIDANRSIYHNYSSPLSGLRFNDLADSSPTRPNPGSGVLAVDSNGDVIYVPENAGFGYCPHPDSLSGNAGIVFKDHNIYFDGQDTNPGLRSLRDAIGLGYKCDDTLPAKLSVDETSPLNPIVNGTIAGRFHNGDRSGGGMFEKTGIQSISDGISVYTYSGATNVGGDFVAVNANTQDIGIRSKAGSDSSSVPDDVIIGGQFIAENGTINSKGVDVSVISNSVNATGIYVNVDDTSGTAEGIYANVYGNNVTGADINVINSQGTVIGVSSSVYQSADRDAYGISSFCVNFGGDTSSNYGIFSEPNYGEHIYGGYFIPQSEFTNDNIGVYTISDGLASNTNYGIYASAPVNGCDTPVNTTNCATAAGFFDGDVGITDNLYVGSDVKLKDNIQPLKDAMATLIKLSPKTYTFRTKDYPSVNLSARNQYGLIADDIEQIIPSLVKHFKVLPKMDSLHHYDPQAVVDIKELNYIGIIAFLIEGTKEQQQTIDSLSRANQNTQGALDSIRTALSQLQSQINGCCGSDMGMRKAGGSDNNNNNGNNTNPANGGNAIPVDLANAIILNQNDPNPFRERTSISYNISGEVQNAQIVFFDNLGRILKTVVINERGAGMLDVFAGNLSSGIYSYSLIADGNVIDTKKMVCNK